MSTYRSPPTPRAPTIVATNHTLGDVFMLLVIYGFLSIFVVILFSRATLTCDRSEGRCSVVVERGPGIVFKKETFAFTSLERASVESHVDHEGDRLEGIALVRDGKAELLDGSSNVGHDGKVEWTETVNAFLRDPSRDHIEISRGAIWPVYAWCLVGLAWLVAMLRTRTRFIIDKDTRLLTLEFRGLFVRSQAFPLKDIAAAELYAKESDDTVVHGIRLLFKDGTARELTKFLNINEREKTRVIDAVNAALREED